MPTGPVAAGRQLQAILGNLYGTADPLLAARQAGTIRPGVPPAIGFPTAPSSPGALAGLPAYGGSPAAGRIPQVPDPTMTAATATAGNIANAPTLGNLFNLTGGTYVPGFEGLQATESQNIANLLGGQYNLPEAFRRTAELGSMAPGGAQADAARTAEILWHRRFEDQARQEGAQRLSQAVARGRGVLDLATMMQTPEQRQQWSYLASQLAAAPDPEAAFQRALALAREGINRGFNTGYGSGGGGTTLSTSASPAASIAQRYSGPSPFATAGTPAPTGPGWGQASGTAGTFRTEGGLPFQIPTPPNIIPFPTGGFTSPGEVPFSYRGDPMDLVGTQYGGAFDPRYPGSFYSSPGSVPFDYAGNPSDLVRQEYRDLYE